MGKQTLAYILTSLFLGHASPLLQSQHDTAENTLNSTRTTNDLSEKSALYLQGFEQYATCLTHAIQQQDTDIILQISTALLNFNSEEELKNIGEPSRNEILFSLASSIREISQFNLRCQAKIHRFPSHRQIIKNNSCNGRDIYYIHIDMETTLNILTVSARRRRIC